MGLDRSCLLVLTGMHRSGTTFPGRALSSVKGLLYLHEPFNAKYGCEGVDTVYPWAGPDGEGLSDGLDRTIQDVAALKCAYKGRAEGDSLIKAAARMVIRGRGGIDLLNARLRSVLVPGNHKLLLKDPFAMLLSPYLARKYGARIVIMVRHPVAIWQSVKRMGWTLSFNDFGGPGFWYSQAAKGVSREDLEKKTEAEKVAWLWRFLYQDVAEWASSWPENIIFVRHEDLCADPAGQMKRVVAHYGLDAGGAFYSKLDELTQGENVAARGARLHDFKRDSRALATSWMKKADSIEEGLIRGITAGAYDGLYERWRPYEDVCR